MPLADESAKKTIEVRCIFEEDDLIRNKSLIIELLEDNMRINFPDICDFAESVNNGYNNMLRFHSDGSAILIGAFEGVAIIGFLWAYTREVLGEKRLHISHIIVNSKARSSGIGKRLLNKLEDIANKKGIKRFELMTTVENENTMKFYMSNGFVPVRVQLEKKWGEPDDNRKNSN